MEFNSETINMTSRGKMEYIKRQIEEDLIKSFNNYKVVLITGARQVGKTRLIKELFSNVKYINFDNIFYEN